MATRTIKGTLDTLQVDTGSEITYKGQASTGKDTRAFEVNPGGTGNIIVDIDKSSGVSKVEIFQDDAYTGSSRATGYQTITNINKITIWLLILFASQAIFSYFRILIFVIVTEKTLAAIRQQTYNHILKHK